MRGSAVAAAWLCAALLQAAGAPAAAADADAGQPAALTADGGRYFGPLVNGRREGWGRIEWSSGARYEGEFRNGLFEGRGRLRSATGEVYDGDFVKGVRSGKGRLTSRSGASYVGSFRDGEFDGRGRYDDGNGNVYDGEFKAGLFHGRGRSTGLQAEYEGGFVQGKPSGAGEIRYRDGRRYRGAFVKGQFEGKGRFEEPSGAVYEGDFVASEFTGHGVHSAPGGWRHEGPFRRWRPHGPGRATDGDGNRYEGHFVDGDIVGPARIVMVDGSRYSGELKAWLPHGRGELRRANGDTYRGQFIAGRFEGVGTLTYAEPRPDGRTHDNGPWREGRSLRADDDERRRVEAALYGEATRLERALANLVPRDPRTINLYLLSVAGDASLEVFRREAEFVKRQFDAGFDTAGRSLVLANPRSGAADAPLATRTSIRRALAAMGERMDRQTDILFLHLASRGAADDALALALPGVELSGLTATELAEMLATSGIRWRVIVVSSCDADGFVDALSDPQTLVIAAGRHERRASDCAGDGALTAFGRAFFQEALPDSASFESAFARARNLLAARADRDTARPPSGAGGSDARRTDDQTQPQSMASPAVREHLERWWHQRARLADGRRAPGTAAGPAR